MGESKQEKIIPRGQEIATERGIVEIRNLFVDSLPRVILNPGDITSLREILAKTEGIKAIIWNEERISLMADRPGLDITYAPELHPSVAIFFGRSDENPRHSDPFTGKMPERVWEGDYEPVTFSKRALLKYLRYHSAIFPPTMEDAIKNLKVSQMETSEEILLDEHSDDERTIRENRTQTNVPNLFTVQVPLTEGYIAELVFESAVVLLKDRYGNARENKRGIQLRLTNGREVKRQLMDYLLGQLPSDYPRYYGKIAIVPK